MSLLIGFLITFLVIILVLYLINMLPLDGRAKQIPRGNNHHRHHFAAEIFGGGPEHDPEKWPPVFEKIILK